MKHHYLKKYLYSSINMEGKKLQMLIIDMQKEFQHLNTLITKI